MEAIGLGQILPRPGLTCSSVWVGMETFQRFSHCIPLDLVPGSHLRHKSVGNDPNHNPKPSWCGAYISMRFSGLTCAPGSLNLSYILILFLIIFVFPIRAIVSISSCLVGPNCLLKASNNLFYFSETDDKTICVSQRWHPPDTRTNLANLQAPENDEHSKIVPRCSPSESRRTGTYHFSGKRGGQWTFVDCNRSAKWRFVRYVSM